MKIDTHLHLGGCITPDFVWGVIANNDNLRYLAESPDDVIKQMTFSPNEPKEFQRFLHKFKILDELPWNEQLIDESIKSVSEFLKINGVDYAWLDFSINKYMNIGWHKHEAIKFIYDSFNKYRPGGVGLILSLKYESPQPSQKQYAKLIDNPEVANMLIGIDLVGDELYYDANFYKPLFADWNKAGKMTRAHVGESQTCNNVLSSIIDLGVTNIAHGIKIVESDYAIAKAKDHEVTFDLALTSNCITGAYEGHHPIIDMISKGLKITLGSDDPIQCGTNLDKEFELARSMGISDEDIDKMSTNASDNTLKLFRA